MCSRYKCYNKKCDNIVGCCKDILSFHLDEKFEILENYAKMQELCFDCVLNFSFEDNNDDFGSMGMLLDSVLRIIKKRELDKYGSFIRILNEKIVEHNINTKIEDDDDDN